MERLLNQNEREKLQDMFKAHPLFLICFRVFTPRMARLDKGFLVTPIDVFCESAQLLDFLLSQTEINQHQVDSLWDLLFIDIMKWGTNVTDHNKRMITGTVFQVVRASLTQYYDSYYSDTICELLNHTIERELNGCDEKEQEKFLQQLMNQSPELCDWINSYDEAEEWLSDQITDTFEVKSGTTAKRTGTSKQKKKVGEKKLDGKPKTLKYYKHGNNGVLMKQRERVDIVFRLWNKWDWIDDQTTPDDFDAFFAGEPRHCNITWKANSTILTILLQKLINQPYIEKQTGCAAKSLVEQQFGKTANSSRKRLDEDSEVKIRLTLLVLDTKNPLPERHGRTGNEEINIQEAALREIFAGQLCSTKSI